MLPIIFLTLLSISTLFPIVASLGDANSFPSWVGWLDVFLALIVILTMFVIETKSLGKITQKIKEDGFHMYRLLANVPIFLLVIFFLFGDIVAWDVLLPGLAWRAWVLMYSLPSVLALWDRDSNHR